MAFADLSQNVVFKTNLILNQTIKSIAYGNIEYYGWLFVHMTQLWMSSWNNHTLV